MYITYLREGKDRSDVTRGNLLRPLRRPDSSGLLMVLELLTAGAGLFKQTLVAAQFGTSALTDAYMRRTNP
jgi:hypothetical protein